MKLEIIINFYSGKYTNLTTLEFKCNFMIKSKVFYCENLNNVIYISVDSCW